MTEAIRGIDVAKWQGAINWREVAKSGVQFAIIKCSEGVGYTDPRFKQNWKEARAVGLFVGAYHFARVSRSSTIDADAEAEATYFAKTVGPLTEGCLPLALDIEWDKRADGIKPAEIVRWCEVFCVTVEKLTGRAPMIYTGYNFWQWKLAKTKTLARYLLWQVLYSTKTKISKPIPGWPTQIWQHSHTMKIPGIVGDVDGNRWLGTLDELRKLAGYDVEPSAAVPRVDPVVNPDDTTRRIEPASIAPVPSVVVRMPPVAPDSPTAIAIAESTPKLGVLDAIISFFIEKFAGVPRRSKDSAA